MIKYIWKSWILIIVYSNYVIMKEKIFEYKYWFQTHEWERAKFHMDTFIGLIFLYSTVYIVYMFPRDGLECRRWEIPKNIESKEATALCQEVLKIGYHQMSLLYSLI